MGSTYTSSAVVRIEFEVFRPSGQSTRKATIDDTEHLQRFIDEVTDLFAQAQDEWREKDQEREKANG